MAVIRIVPAGSPKITHGSSSAVDLFNARANVLQQAFARLRGATLRVFC